MPDHIPPHHNPENPETKPREGTSRDVPLPMLPDGTQPIRLGSGTIKSVLGAGGAAIVYEVWNERLGVSHALKLLRPNANIESIGRFETEMKLMAQLRHRNIVQVHAVGEWHGLPYFEMEKIDGVGLEVLIERRGALPIVVVLALGIMICRALVYTHSYEYRLEGVSYVGILHRDLKPSNILIAEDGVAYLSDFGIATPTNISMHTMAGTVVGSLQYLAPEQLDGKKLDTRADIFSFGCLLYEMVTGAKTFPECNISKLSVDRMKNRFRPLNAFDVRIPRPLRKLIMACLETDREKRIGTMEIALAQIQKLYDRYTDSEPELILRTFMETEGDRRNLLLKRRWHAKAAGATVVVAAVIFFLVGIVPRMRKATSPIQAPPAGIGSVQKGFAAARTEAPATDAPEPKPKQPPPVRAGARRAVRKVPSRTARRPRRKAAASARRRSAPARTSRPPKRKLTIAEVLLREYGTADFLFVLAAEVRKGHHERALRFYTHMPPEVSKSPEAILWKMRAISGLNDPERTGRFFQTTLLDEKEYYLEKAGWLIRRNRRAEAIKMLNRARVAGAQLGNEKMLNREALYLLARCHTEALQADADPAAVERALSMWYDVKYAFRNNQDHEHFAESNRQIRRLTTQYDK